MSDLNIALELLGYPNKDLTLQQAENVLDILTNNGQVVVDKDILRQLANSVLADTTGDFTLLYSGDLNGNSSSTVVRSLNIQDRNLRLLGNTPAAE